jgi:hypothetical protein
VASYARGAVREFALSWLALSRTLCGSCALLSLTHVAHAQPELHAELAWQGSCNDTEDLRRQVRARGAELSLQSGWAPADAEGARGVRVEIAVSEPANATLIADIRLQSEQGKEARRVQASACGDLRSAVAWVLVVLAQQRAPERTVPPARAAESGPTAASPSQIPDASPAPLPEPALQTLTTSGDRPAPRPSVRGAERRDSAWALGCSLIGGLGLLSAPALGPMVFGRYRHAGTWLPTLQLSAQRLVTFGFESNGTSISLTRDAARLGAWVPLVGSWLNAGLAVEAGRLVAAGSGATLSRASSDATFWVAFALPLRFSVPLIGQRLRAELQLELDYSPVPYTFRFESGDTLTSTAAFEGRGQVGLVSLF